jgi:hypothetical protein
VRIVLADDATWAEVYGIGHRHPRVVQVSMALAAKLAAAGAPVTVLDQRGAGSAVGSST